LNISKRLAISLAIVVTLLGASSFIFYVAAVNYDNSIVALHSVKLTSGESAVITPRFDSVERLWIANVSTWQSVSVHIQENASALAPGNYIGVFFANSVNGPYLLAGSCAGSGFNGGPVTDCELMTSSEPYGSGILTTTVQGAFIGITSADPTTDNVTIFATSA
jgi:hypothetical protein